MNIRACLLAPVVAALTISAAAADEPTMKMSGPPPPKPIPASYVAASPCVPTMGVHYVNPKAPFSSPIYGTYQGKPVFTEVMMTPKELAAGKNWVDVLKPLPGYAINHVDIEYEPHGHPGMTFAHYDVHAYYVPHAVHEKFCLGNM